MGVGYVMPIFRKQVAKDPSTAYRSEEASTMGQSTGTGATQQEDSFPSLSARFAKPNGLFEPRHTGSSRAADSEQQRWSHSEAAAKGKGYELLAKAGYKGSGGLGPSESGITSPIPAWHNQGRMGIGTVLNPAAAGGGQLASRTGQLSAREVQHGSQDSAKADQHRQTRKRSKPPNKDWASVRVEEDVQVKVKRVKQVMRAEAEAAADRALAQALYREFNDIGGHHSADTNPLLRRSKLSASNPLL